MKSGLTIMVDLDGVICSEQRVFERPLAKPIDGAKESLQKLKDAGNTIVVYTARGWAEYNVTKDWLDRHGMAYDALHMGKPIGHVWIDDRAIGFKDWGQALGQLDEF
jgi:uncharacterized HAD superfamily protein